MPRFIALPTETARAYRSGQPDANGQPPERRVADCEGLPCRHCLDDIAIGDEYLIFAHRTFPEIQPYAEVGPIFLHARDCTRYQDETKMPPLFHNREHVLMRGYGASNRIVYGSGKIVNSDQLPGEADRVLEREDVAYVHIRSATNNCFQCRVERNEEAR